MLPPLLDDVAKVMDECDLRVTLGNPFAADWTLDGKSQCIPVRTEASQVRSGMRLHA